MNEKSRYLTGIFMYQTQFPDDHMLLENEKG